MTTHPADPIQPDHDTGSLSASARHTLSVVQTAMHARRPLYLTGPGTPPASAGVTTGFSAQHQGLFNLLAMNAMVRTNAVVLQPSLRDFLG